MEPTISLDTIYTANEAAERLRLTARGIIKLGRQYGLCSRRGRDYLFSESDLLGLWEVLREPERAPRPATVKAPQSDLRLYETLQKLTKKRRPGRKRWDATQAKNTEVREATKAAIGKLKDDETLESLAKKTSTNRALSHD